MDQITLDRIGLLHPKVRTDAYVMYNEMCEAVKGRAMVRFSYTLRSFAEQDALYALGRTVKNPNGYDPVKRPFGFIVTWAKGGDSFHNYGLAWDLVIILDKDGNGIYETASWDNKIDLDGDGIADWMEIVLIAKKYGYEWGGDWVKPKTDTPHFQKTFGYKVSELKQLFNSKKFIPNTNYLSI